MSTGAPLAHPGVRFPPPLLFVLGLGVGIGLHRLWPLALPGELPRAPIVAASGFLGATGLGLIGWAVHTFRSARTGIYPNKPASQVVARGPFRFSRNPMYVGMSLIYVGLALWAGTLWPVLLLPVVLWVLWQTVIRREEQYLTAAFGASYADYTQRVRRWV